MVRCSRLVIFLIQGKFCVKIRTRRQVACEMLISLKRCEDLAEKIISPVIFDTDRSFKQ